MKPQEIAKLNQLDPNGCYGTLQQLLLDPNINQIGYAEALYHLLSKCIDEKGYLERVNRAMTNALQTNGLQTNGLHSDLNKCLELKDIA